MRIGIDIDDTLTDIKDELYQAATNYATTLGKKIESINNFEDKNNNGNKWQEVFHFDYQELKYFLKEIQEEITNKAVPREGVVDVIQKLKKDGNEIIYTKILESNLAFDHAKMLIYAIERLKNKVEYTTIAFNLMPEKFTLTKLQQVYEILLDKPLLKANFRRKIADMVIETEEYEKNAGHRPSKLYCFNKNWQPHIF